METYLEPKFQYKRLTSDYIDKNERPIYTIEAVFIGYSESFDYSLKYYLEFSSLSEHETGIALDSYAICNRNTFTGAIKLVPGERYIILLKHPYEKTGKIKEPMEFIGLDSNVYYTFKEHSKPTLNKSISQLENSKKKSKKKYYEKKNEKMFDDRYSTVDYKKVKRNWVLFDESDD